MSSAKAMEKTDLQGDREAGPLDEADGLDAGVLELLSHELALEDAAIADVVEEKTVCSHT